MKRFEIYLARLDPTQSSEMAKTRPVVIVSDDLRNQSLQNIVVCPLTTHLRPTWRCRLRVQSGGKPADVAVDQIRVLDKQRLSRRLGRLTPAAAASLQRLISEMYGDG